MNASRAFPLTTLLIILWICPGLLSAAEPPGLINYQGVLRDASDNPLNGNREMVFSFYDAETSGNEILIDYHTATYSDPVTVSGGMAAVTCRMGPARAPTRLSQACSGTIRKCGWRSWSTRRP